MRRFRENRLEFFSSLYAQYGELCYFQMGPQPICLLNAPELIKQILVRDYRSFKKGRFLEMAKDLLGEGLLTSGGEHHDRQRRIIQPLFHRQKIRNYAETMVKRAVLLREQWQANQEIDMAAEMMRLTLAIVGETLFNADVEGEAAELGKAMYTVLETIKMVGNPWALLVRKYQLNTPGRRRLMAAQAILDQTIAEIISQHRQGKSNQQDLIATLLEARDSEGNGEGMSDKQIRDEALTLFMAGHETTANALAWTWHLLAQHPRVMAGLKQELQHVIGDRLPDVEDLSQLRYTRQILTESMRLYPPAWILGRTALEEYTLNESYYLPQGAVVIMSQYLVHRDPRWYTQPESFLPERWSEAFRHSLPKFAYFPFGGGPRNCIGEAFAWMEGILILATLAQKWEAQAIEAHPVEPEPLVTLRPRYGLKMKLIQSR